MTKKDAALHARIGEETLHRWCKDPAFVAALNESQAGVIDEVSRRGTALLLEAYDTIAGIMRDPETSNKDRVLAARTIIDSWLKVQEMVHIQALTEDVDMSNLSDEELMQKIGRH